MECWMISSWNLVDDTVCSPLFFYATRGSRDKSHKLLGYYYKALSRRDPLQHR